MLGVETEFYVFRRDGLPDLVPIAPSSSLFPTPAYDVESTLDSLDFLAEVARHLAAADFGLFSFDHEGGNGQYELDCAHAEALELCDRLVYLRLLLRHVAGRQGCFVTFMPKPMRTSVGIRRAHEHEPRVARRHQPVPRADRRRPASVDRARHARSSPACSATHRRCRR